MTPQHQTEASLMGSLSDLDFDEYKEFYGLNDPSQ